MKLTFQVTNLLFLISIYKYLQYLQCRITQVGKRTVSVLCRVGISVLKIIFRNPGFFLKQARPLAPVRNTQEDEMHLGTVKEKENVKSLV